MAAIILIVLRVLLAIGLVVFALLIVGAGPRWLANRGWRRIASHATLVEATGAAVLATAVWIASPLLPDTARMGGWSFVLVLLAVVLRATDRLPESAPAAMRLGKGLGVAVLVCGVAVLVGAASGARDPLRPFEAFTGARVERTAAATPVRFERVATLAELDSRLAAAGRPAMLDFYADWCVSCKEMEKFTFSDPGVRARLDRMLLLQADVTKGSPDDRALLRRFNLFGPPGTIFFDAQGRELRSRRVIGFQPAERFAATLDGVFADSQQRNAR